jgi:hypothetical protein
MAKAKASAERRTAPVLDRVTFKTSRLAEFCSDRELVAQTGHPIVEWPLVILKELVDNAIDICEEKASRPRSRSASTSGTVQSPSSTMVPESRRRLSPTSSTIPIG